MTIHSSIFIDSDSVLSVEGLRDRSGSLVSTATVTLDAFIDKRSGATVAGITLPAEFTNLDSGNYELALPNELALTENRIYSATITAISTSGYRREWTETMIAKRGVA